MRIVIAILCLWSLSAKGELVGNDNQTIEFSGLSARQRRREREVDSKAISYAVMADFEVVSEASAGRVDTAMGHIIAMSNVVLKAYGEQKLADTITREYQANYTHAFKSMFAMDSKEIGDHAPFSHWLKIVHEQIEEAVGLTVCKWFHLHDIMILNYGLPTIMRPAIVDFKDFQDAFAGHLIWGVFWEHHGVAGIVSYWLVNYACGGVTSGLGLITYICGPIAGVSESFVDQQLAPPIGKAIWTRANN